MNVKDWKEHFEKNGDKWISGAYLEDGYNYPVGYHRLRILKKIFANYELQNKSVLDIGCGGGDISFFSASLGARVDGIDMTTSMLEIASKKREELPEDVKKNIHFFQGEFHNIEKVLSHKKYDFIIAFGLIGYLESDSMFFETISALCHPRTVIIVSCRNRLFNITSVTPNTVAEIERGTAIELINEIDTYYASPVPDEKVMQFISNIKEVAQRLETEQSIKISGAIKQQDMKSLPGTGERQPRQSTPAAFLNAAAQNGFVSKRLFGVHPHLLLPRLNKKLPPPLFNLLSDALCAFEDELISLIYSSVFIAELSREQSVKE